MGSVDSRPIIVLVEPMICGLPVKYKAVAVEMYQKTRLNHPLK